MDKKRLLEIAGVPAEQMGGMPDAYAPENLPNDPLANIARAIAEVIESELDEDPEADPRVVTDTVFEELEEMVSRLIKDATLRTVKP